MFKTKTKRKTLKKCTGSLREALAHDLKINFRNFREKNKTIQLNKSNDLEMAYGSGFVFVAHRNGIFWQ